MLMEGFPFDAVINGDGQVVKQRKWGKIQSTLRDVVTGQHGSDTAPYETRAVQRVSLVFCMGA